MRAFEHFNAGSVNEAVSLLRRYRGKARVMAGGTDLLETLKNEILPEYPEALINIKTIPGLEAIEEDEQGLKLGALVRLTAVVQSSAVREKWKILAQAAQSVATPEIRNMGTVGGNLCQDTRCWYYRYPHRVGGRILCRRKGEGPCHAVKGDSRYHAIMGGRQCFAVCPSDMATALAVLDARIRIAGPGIERAIPVADFYTTMGHVLQPDEIVTEIQVPPPPGNGRQVFLKFRLREPVDFAVASVAAIVSMADGVCEDAGIVLGGVTPMPYRAKAAENALRGRRLAAAAEEAAEAAVGEARPLRNNAYKMEIAKTLVKRALLP